MKILFVDSKTTENYDFKYMESHSLGGTQSTQLRVARELARNHDVYISQINRTERYVEEGITYIHNSESRTQKLFIPDIIIIIRKYKLLKDYSLIYPNAKLFVWVHNFQNYDILGRRHWIAKTNAQVICVSQCHENHINTILNGYLSWLFRLLTFQFKKVNISYIYNIIDSDFVQTNTPIDPDKLLFFSTVNKGLKEVLVNFKELLHKSPSFKLYIAGSTVEQLEEHDIDKNLIHSDSIIVLGKIPKNEIVLHLQNSFCVFYPQSVHPETFGLIYIEANCCGTPVLAHSFGSTSEVIGNAEQLVNANKPNEVINKILDWKSNGRPKVFCQNKFQLNNVIERWKKTLEVD